MGKPRVELGSVPSEGTVFFRYTTHPPAKNGRGIGNRTPISSFVAKYPGPLNDAPTLVGAAGIEPAFTV